MGLVTSAMPDIEWEPLRSYFEALARHELAFPQCDACGRFQWYPRAMCQDCMGRDFSWTVVPARGRVYSHTVVKRIWLAEAKVPYSVVLVRMDEAPGVTLICNLADENQRDKLAIDVPVTFEFLEVGAEKKTDRRIVMPFARLSP